MGISVATPSPKKIVLSCLKVIFFQKKGICNNIFQFQKIVSPFNDFSLQKMNSNDFICIKNKFAKHWHSKWNPRTIHFMDFV
jgi:hypothetical protein